MSVAGEEAAASPLGGGLLLLLLFLFLAVFWVLGVLAFFGGLFVIAPGCDFIGSLCLFVFSLCFHFLKIIFRVAFGVVLTLRIVVKQNG